MNTHIPKPIVEEKEVEKEKVEQKEEEKKEEEKEKVFNVFLQCYRNSVTSISRRSCRYYSAFYSCAGLLFLLLVTHLLIE